MSTQLVTGVTGSEAVAMPVVEVTGLEIRYGRRAVLQSIGLRIARGEVYALLGRNGAGKSSLVRCLLGQQKPQAGDVRLFGQDAWRGRQELMARVGVVPEEPDAPPELTARQLVLLCGRLNRRWDAASVFDRMQRFGVPLGTAFHRLSKGEKGAVMLALALGHGPELLVLDDPTLGLDVVVRRTVFSELIGDLADRGTTVLVTTHDLAGVEGIADRIGILRAGHLVLEGELGSLKSEHSASLEELFTATTDEAAARASHGGRS